MEEIKYKGYKIEIEQDENPQNPREDFDNATTMICFHRRYNLGDKHDFNHGNYNSWDELEKAIVKQYKPVIIKPQFLLDHSGITISTEDFNDRWDSGRIGFVLITRKSILECYGMKRITNAIKEKAGQLLDAEVQMYDDFVRGDVYGYRIINGEEEVDSCWGYFGFDYEKSGLLEAAKNVIDCALKSEQV